MRLGARNKLFGGESQEIICNFAAHSKVFQMKKRFLTIAFALLLCSLPLRAQWTGVSLCWVSNGNSNNK